MSPEILASERPSSITLREEDNVTLACEARGYPHPSIEWKREDGENNNYGQRFRWSSD